MKITACRAASLGALTLVAVAMFAPGVALAVDATAAQALARQNNCFKCHAVDKKKEGPAWKEVAAKLKSDNGCRGKAVQAPHDRTEGEIRGRPPEDHPIIKSKTPTRPRTGRAGSCRFNSDRGELATEQSNDESPACGNGTKQKGERHETRSGTQFARLHRHSDWPSARPAPCRGPAGMTSKDDRVKEALAKDAVCTKCHDESDNKPILSYYQTRHGVKADARTPGCQTCHGASDAHVKNPQGVTPRPLPDIGVRNRPEARLVRRRSDGRPASPVTSRATAPTGRAASHQ